MITTQTLPSFPTQLSFKMRSYAQADSLVDDDTYLAFSNCILTNEDFNLISDAGIRGWYKDSHVDVSFELLEEKYHCEDLGVGLVNSFVAGIIYRISKEPTDQRDYSQWNGERDMLKDKKFLFFPINDGYDVTEYLGQPSGSHWSLLVIDMVNKIAYYIDGMMPGEYNLQAISGQMAMAFETVGVIEDLLDVELIFEVMDTYPDQYVNNKAEESGPCGPYICYMTELYIQALVEADGRPQAGSMLPDYLADSPLWDFNSTAIRANFQQILREKKFAKLLKEQATALEATKKVEAAEKAKLKEHATAPEAPMKVKAADKAKMAEETDLEAQHEAIKDHVRGEILRMLENMFLDDN